MNAKLIRDRILFDGDDNLFKKYLKNCKIYFEYGVGQSTIWVLENTKCIIISVDTDKTDNKGLPKVKKELKLTDNLGDLEISRPKTLNIEISFLII